MVIIYGLCEHQARAAQQLYCESFLWGPHLSWQVVVRTVEQFREMDSLTNRPRHGRQRRVDQRVQPEYALVYAFSQSNTREISAHCGHAKNYIWTVLNELCAYPYRPISEQALMASDAQRYYDWCNFTMNSLMVQPTFLAGSIWTEEACFSHNTM